MSHTELGIKVFISYAHADQELHKKLVEHLSSLTHSGEITIWQDQEIPLGANWEDQIDTHLHEANIILLLVSASFIASNYCWNREVKIALERHKAGEVQVIPILLKPALWQNTPLRQLQVLPTGAKPITQWSDQEAAFEDVARGIRSAVETSLQREQEGVPDLPSVQLPPLIEVTHLEQSQQSLSSISPATTSILNSRPSDALSGIQQQSAEGKKIRSRRLAPLVLIGLIITMIAILTGGLMGWFLFFRGVTVGTVTEFAVSTSGSSPQGIIAGPDGNLWFTEFEGNNIGRISTSGTITGEFPLPANTSQPNEITVGPDGNLWFTETGVGKIGRISTNGKITGEFDIPTPDSQPWGITVGSDGNLWFTEAGVGKIGRISISGHIDEFDIPIPDSQPRGITKGPDNNLWFVEYNGSNIGRISTSGRIDEFPLTAGSNPRRITVGSDRNLWFTEWGGNNIGRISTNGKINEFAAPTFPCSPQGITAGPDDNLWFTEYNGNKIGQISINGKISEFAVPTSPSVPEGITVGPDKNLWFTEFGGNKIGRITSGK